MNGSRAVREKSLARRDVLARMAAEEVDLLVVGGGATGAAVARDAALRGLSVALCEAGDFASQTSSHSSQLIHGGLRYLQYGDLHLVFEGLTERRHLMTTAPHLCRPIEFLFPAYAGERPGLRTLGAGIALYNALALWRPPAAARRLPAGEVYEACPSLRSAGLTGAQLYVDCQTDDARLVLENVLDAESSGALAASYLPVRQIVRDRAGRARGALAVDEESGQTIAIRARVVVNATGPFSDSFDLGRHNLRPTLGVHLVFDAARIPLGGRALVLRTPRDNRLFFALPAGARTVIGTTDTDWEDGAENAADSARGSPAPPRVGDPIRARRADVAYLLEAANHAFPPAALGEGDVISTYAGLRPLIAVPAHTPSATSREHEILREPDGVISVVGGKLTTMRRMAEEIVDRVAERLRDLGGEGAIGPCLTAERPLPGGDGDPPDLGTNELAPEIARHLRRTYGVRAGRVATLATEAPSLMARIDPELPYLWAEVVHAARHDHARTVEDALRRRIPLYRHARDQGLGAAERAGDLLAGVLGWSAAVRAASVGAYHQAVALSRAWKDD
ncbi:MAG TPA: glycerol-3-phosphate dehydrogenase/oxidase [Polyangia bacterium]|nr:glycerol-3-phosphate dehydrogenase/oxidase [Polyangia bacterium]